MPDGDLLTPSEAAQRLRVTTKTLRRWALAGKVAAVTLPSGQLRYPLSEIESITSEQVAS